VDADGGVDDRRPPASASPNPACVLADLELHRTMAGVQRPRDHNSHRIQTGTADLLVERDSGAVAVAALGVAVAAFGLTVATLGVVAMVSGGMRARYGLNRCCGCPEKHE
jgi:hypothetical protein